MRKLVARTMMSLDGVMQAPGGPDEDRGGGFEFGGWAMPYVDEMELYAIMKWMAKAGGVVLGRRTYDIFAAYWPTHSGKIADMLNDSPKYVASRKPLRQTWQHTERLQGDVVAAIRKLKGEPGGELQIHGSGNLIQTLHRHGVIDEYRIWTFPVVLGKGKRLFEHGAAPRALELMESRKWRTGVTLQVLRNGGQVQHGVVGKAEPAHLRSLSMTRARWVRRSGA